MQSRHVTHKFLTDNIYTVSQKSYRLIDCFMRPIRLALLSSKMLLSSDKMYYSLYITDKLTSHYVNRQINVSYYQQISNCCRPVLTYWPIDWRHQWLTDCWSCTAFSCDSFSLLRHLCTVGHGIFLYGQCKQLLVSELNNAYFCRHLFEKSVWLAKYVITVCFTYSLSITIFWT